MLLVTREGEAEHASSAGVLALVSFRDKNVVVPTRRRVSRRILRAHKRSLSTYAWTYCKKQIPTCSSSDSPGFELTCPNVRGSLRGEPLGLLESKLLNRCCTTTGKSRSLFLEAGQRTDKKTRSPSSAITNSFWLSRTTISECLTHRSRRKASRAAENGKR